MTKRRIYPVLGEGYVWPDGSVLIAYGPKDKWNHRSATVKCGVCGETREVKSFSDKAQTGRCLKCHANSGTALQMAWSAKKAQLQARLDKQAATGLKHCVACIRDLPFSAFNKKTRAYDGLGDYCAICTQVKKRDRMYSLAPGEYDARAKAQNNVCAVKGCTRPIEVVDHDHATGAIRGLICAPHNMMLPHHTSKNDLQNLAEYLPEENKTDPPER